MRRYIIQMTALLAAVSSLLLPACGNEAPKGDVILKKCFLPQITGYDVIDDTLIRLRLAKPLYLPPALVMFKGNYYDEKTNSYTTIHYSHEVEKGKKYTTIDFSRWQVSRVEHQDPKTPAFSYESENAPFQMFHAYDSLVRLRHRMSFAHVEMWTMFPVMRYLEPAPRQKGQHVVACAYLIEDGSIRLIDYARYHVLLEPTIAGKLRAYGVLTLSDSIYSDNHNPGNGYRRMHYKSWEELFGALRPVVPRLPEE